MDLLQDPTDLNHSSNSEGGLFLEGIRHAKHTTRDQRRDVHILHRNGFSRPQIAVQLGLTEGQVRYAINQPPTPKKKTGRHSKITPEELEYLIEWICATKENRRCRWELIPIKAGLPHLGFYCIRHALRKAGFFRRVARRKPPISEKNQLERLEFAHEHLHWTFEQWAEILWSDETWMTAGNHTRVWVTRRAGEEYDPTCVIEREQRKGGWMFWGCFHGTIKGPGFFWEKEWGSINGKSYREHTIPVIDGWIRLCASRGERLFFMQDNSRAHWAAATRAELEARSIRVIDWPAYSPDLNPIEYVWNKMKDYIQEHFPHKMSYDRLREAVKEAWEAIPTSYLEELINSMRDRCQAVIDANGMHTKY